jgi:hypothetical protein
MKLYVVADVPDRWALLWLNHMQNFDTLYKGCHFELMKDLPHIALMDAIEVLRDTTVEELMRMLNIDPSVSLHNLIRNLVDNRRNRVVESDDGIESIESIRSKMELKEKYGDEGVNLKAIAVR